MKKTFVFALAVLLAVQGVVFASGRKDNGGNSENRTITDMAGRTVVVPKTVDKVFVAGGSAITLIMTLGATDKLLTVPSAFQSETFAWARVICPEIDNIKIDDNALTNVEAVLTYNPDVVITLDKNDVERYAPVGLPTIFISITNYDTFKESMLIVGTVLGETELEVAKKYNKYLDDHVAMVSERTAALATEVKQSVYYIDGRFNKGIYHTVGTGEIQERWISIAGAKLATARDFQGRDIEIAAEKFLTIDPDIIMIGAQNQAEVYDELISDNVLSELSAVKNGKIYRIPQGIFPWCRTGPEGAIQVVWAGKLLHPDLFADIDIAVVARGFYKEFYGTDISDEHLQGILNGQLSPGGK